MKTLTILVTGANGEVGHGLIAELSKKKNRIIAWDLHPLARELNNLVTKSFRGSILSKNLTTRIFKKYNFDTIYHLAALLSTSGEKTPIVAHDVNINGTLNLLEAARKQSEKTKKAIKFIFPSSIAVYGLPNTKTKMWAGKVKEDEFLNPITMYGINKLYCEHLGSYYSHHYSQLTTNTHFIDFRCVRFPGLISSQTIPSGGTSDYAPEMLHTAARGEAYQCFVKPITKIPFMAMPDAVNSLLQLNKVPKNKLTRQVYNVGGFSASAQQIAKVVKKHFPNTKITYKVDKARQKIVDSWPENVDDKLAKRDWNWKANYDFNSTFENYLIPDIQKKYK